MKSRLCLFSVAFLGFALASQTGYGQLVLNEVCADNPGVALSPGGSSPDYIEIYNTSSAAVPLSGWALTDDARKPAKFPFPATAAVPGHGFAVVWLEDSWQTYDGIVCTNFSLKISGEQVQLYQGANLRDTISFGPQISGVPLSRIPDGAGAWQLGIATAGNANSALPASELGLPIALRLNEWLATNSAGADMDWLEVYNPKTNGAVALAGLVISDQQGSVSTTALPQYSYIESGGFLRFWCDDSTGGNHLPFKLSSTSGETLSIYQPDRKTVIDRVTFGPQSPDVSMGRLPDGGSNILYFAGEYMSPGAANLYRPVPNIVVNEVLAHTDPPFEDAIEFLNTGDSPADISNWWLSNNEDEPYKFRVPAGTVIAAHGYMVFYEQNQLNAPSTVPGFNRSGTGNQPDFTLNSAHGDSVVLLEATASGALTGLRLNKNFDASANAVSFGRYVKSDGGTDFVPMSRLSFGSDQPLTVTQFRTGKGLSNPGPLVGPLVISEIFYQPPPIVANEVTNDNTLDEFIELTSITNGVLPLYDPQFPTNTWRLRSGISYDFPQNTIVPANGTILLVNFDPVTNLTQLAGFRTRYSVPESVPLFGPYNGKLNNSSDTIELQKPDTVQLPPHPDAGFVPFVLVEKVKYEATNGWPTNVSGTGLSLQRLNLAAYANDQTNWVGAVPSAGRISGSGPSDIRLVDVRVAGSSVTFGFSSEANRAYTVEYAPELNTTNWTTLKALTGTGGTVTFEEPLGASASRFYRVRTP